MCVEVMRAWRVLVCGEQQSGGMCRVCSSGVHHEVVAKEACCCEEWLWCGSCAPKPDRARARAPTDCGGKGVVVVAPPKPGPGQGGGRAAICSGDRAVLAQ